MEYIDYYKILDIKKDASADEIKKAYRKLARKYHPDVNQNNAEANKKFQQINEANEVLSDPEKRKKYDRYGKDWQHADQFDAQQRQQQSRSGGRRSAGNPFSGGFSGGDFSDFFASMFGGAGSSSGFDSPFKGQDYTSDIHLSLLDASTTHKQTLTINGKQVRITIPAGVENGQKIKLPGYGAPGPHNGPPGDLYLTFSIAEHPKFKRKGNDIYLNEPIDLYTAVLGGEKVIETLNGKVKLQVPAGTQPETSLRLKGKGFPVYKKDGHFGNLYVKWQIKIPTNLSSEQRELFEKLAKTHKTKQ
ncbi:DnaJ C-terminal domain-containing protein [Pedobacter sp. MW01-1-1]|uniref:DnaJ C-terminal domain-containing protein n=1 Tax=Pedobacter sp. MW01-1-1 TaxID=3383027 RepID=UPI003FEFAC61